MLGRGKDILNKNNDALTSLVKTGGCVDVTVYVPSVATGKSTSMGTLRIRHKSIQKMQQRNCSYRKIC